ncbi:lytic transglycosylase domain-containing protein [Brevundimonas sp.]|uniref:lytic transglycosylase domain-containing protein n=1 Tax=Brevundimonas sp. TaxID=1871086 RepID=UPI001AD25A36|nr:lytic transglycosylase domain-containing protein [Brevundimonas sp.]MBN9466290.1 lytic transglycosylase domain-containing protein [Brevundimonas sp.]
MSRRSQRRAPRRWSEAAAILTVGVLIFGTPVAAEPPQTAGGGAVEARDFAPLIEEASRRFGVPVEWIRAVMRQESAFDHRALSAAGAMGLMQVMPATYAELRRRHGLGPDPYDPRDNILAGVAYLRELHDQFGLEGMLAAYNAGPGRYVQHRDSGRPLPAETRDYVARISRNLGLPHRVSPARSRPDPEPDPAYSALFPAYAEEASNTPATLFIDLRITPDPSGVEPR